MRHLAGNRNGARTPSGSKTEETWLTTPRFVRTGLQELTENQKASVSVFHCNPSERLTGRSSRSRFNKGCVLSESSISAKTASEEVS